MSTPQPEPASTSSPQEDDDATDSFSSYLDYNKNLRTWFVAFGIGGPALFLVNEKIAEKLAKLGELQFVATLFLMGAASQVLGAFLNKVANWYVYRSAGSDVDRSSAKYKLAHWLIEQFWIDVVLDVVTIACFGVAAWKMLTAFAVHG